MKEIRSAVDMRNARRDSENRTKPWGLVPTMGFLHEGHLSLLDLARADNDVVVMSIFVNPLQFGPDEDFETYPRDEARDLELARQRGVDIVFLPSVEDMYPPGSASRVSVGQLASFLEGEYRPGHFDGVCTVVAKLFNIVAPDRAYFGQKDAQQAAVIKKMVDDLAYGVSVVVGPTVREPDGLALSSRNSYLSTGERAAAPALYEALRAAAEVVEADGSFEEAEERMEKVAGGAGFHLDYAKVVDPATFAVPGSGKGVLLVIAGWLGRTRLIDNLLVELEN
ncbi:MAG: pantoate--beta-alanine ligase [Actinomycetota bacterium]|nr:pantoate--beta-alanine ligase [Actinomycetota bacterium]